MAKRRSDEDQRTILKEAQDRFARCESWEGTARPRFIDDVMFNEGDSDNLYQWPEDIRGRMEADVKPMLTINKTRQHVLDILNDARQSRVAIKIRATGDGASFESAQAYNNVIRYVEYISNAGQAYQTALAFAVKGGIGYWRVITDYANDSSFDQEIFIRRIRDPLAVYLDPDINEFDGSDAKFGFIATFTPREEWEKAHPGQRVPPGANNLTPSTTFMRENAVVTVEYFRRVEDSDTLIAYQEVGEDGQEVAKVVRASEIGALAKVLLAQEGVQKRKIKSHRVEWFKIEGDKIVDEKDWPGVYIPIVRCVGEETVIQGQMDRKGHVRALKDAQRMFNYNSSASVEFGALQSKVPYVGPADAFEQYEEVWNSANTQNPAFLPFNHMDDEGQPIPAPQRQQPPMGAPVYMEGMAQAAEWMRMVSGQYQSDMGAPSNERSGVAITARQRQGDNATYHYLDHQAIAIRYTGKILIDLIPKVYDTERVLRMQGDELGEEMEITIDPSAKQALQKQEVKGGEVKTIFNPKVGKYDVVADVGAAFATKRQEAFNAYTQLLASNKELTAIIGDLMLKAADFPGAEEAAERLKRMVPTQAIQDGPSPDLVAAQQQISGLQKLIESLSQKLADKQGAHLNDQEKNAVTAYKAQTERLGALKDYLQLDPQGLLQLLGQVIEEAQATSGLGLGPALTPSAELTAENMAPPGQPPQPMGLPRMNGALPSGMANGNAEDVTAGPPPMVPGMG